MRKLIVLLFFGFSVSGHAQDRSAPAKHGDTTVTYFSNGCLAQRYVWKQRKNSCEYGYVGKYELYYETRCGQLRKVLMYDEYGTLIYDRVYDEKGNMKELDVPAKVNVKKDSCRYNLGDYFCPDCSQDTAAEAWYFWSLVERCDCRIDSLHVDVRDTSGEQIIYSSDHMWQGIKKQPLNESEPYSRCYYPSGSYPYELLFYSHDGVAHRRTGKVSLIIENPGNICK